jgi:antitoxin PrlF
LLEEDDGLKLRVIRSVPPADVAALAGMVRAPRRGVPRGLQDFDAASLLARTQTGVP